MEENNELKPKKSNITTIGLIIIIILLIVIIALLLLKDDKKETNNSNNSNNNNTEEKTNLTLNEEIEIDINSDLVQELYNKYHTEPHVLIAINSLHFENEFYRKSDVLEVKNLENITNTAGTTTVTGGNSTVGTISQEAVSITGGKLIIKDGN